MRQTLLRVFLLLALAGGLGTLIAGKLVSDAQGDSAQKKKKKKGATLVTTKKVEPTSITDTFSAVGTIRPVESIEIRNEVPGKVVRIGFDAGDRVERGELLLQMRNDTLQADLEVKKRRRDLLQTQVERQRKVLEKGGISQQQFDVTKNELDVLNAELQQIRAELDRTSLRAPFDGRVGLRDVSRGAILTRGTRVAELVETDPVEIEFTVPERFAGSIEEDQTVGFRVHGSSTVHEAKIHALEPRLESETRALRVRAKTDNGDGDLRPGQYAQVRANLDTVEDALVVPSPAVVNSANETIVWVNSGGTAERRRVETGIRTESDVQITEGLSAGEEVVTTGRQTLKPGDELEIDTSDDAMDVDEIGPDPERNGMRNEWFSEETLEEGESDASSESSGETDRESGDDGEGR